MAGLQGRWLMGWLGSIKSQIQGDGSCVQLPITPPVNQAACYQQVKAWLLLDLASLLAQIRECRKRLEGAHHRDPTRLGSCRPLQRSHTKRPHTGHIHHVCEACWALVWSQIYFKLQMLSVDGVRRPSLPLLFVAHGHAVSYK